MKNIVLLGKDITSRRLRGAAISLLTVVIMFTVVMAENISWLSQLAGLILLTGIGLIAYLIVSDSPRHLHFSKAACYSTIIIGTLWVMALLYAISQPQRPLFRFVTDRNSDGMLTGAYFEMSPVIMVSAFGILMLASGLIAYHIGKRRKDIKGIKKEDLFK